MAPLLAFHMSVLRAREAPSDVFTAFICLFVDSFVNILGKYNPLNLLEKDDDDDDAVT